MIESKLLITQCPDPMRWYASLVGQHVEYVGDTGTEYKSREPEGYINFVQHDDAEIVHTSAISQSYSRVPRNGLIRCYQCERPVSYLFADSRCKDCTRLTPEEVQGNDGDTDE